MKILKMRLGKQMLPLGLVLVALSGCATYPVATNLRQQAKPLTLSQVTESPGASQGTIVIWGGRIIKTVNDVNHSAVYVLKLPLDRDGKPGAPADTSGRFIASSRGFLDPEVYKRGRLVTVAGAIAGLKTEPVQKIKYTYPVVDIKQIHVWPVARRHYYYAAPGGGGYYPSWYWGYSPAWGVGGDWYFPGGDWDEGDED